jgi:putative tryptophan/tyrosine transport system substrate-binding protein
MLYTDLAAKELEILTEAVPQAKRIGVLWNPTTPSHPPAVQAVEAAGQKLSVQLLKMPTQTVEDLNRAFATMTREGVGCFLVVGSPFQPIVPRRLGRLRTEAPAARDVWD